MSNTKKAVKKVAPVKTLGDEILSKMDSKPKPNTLIGFLSYEGDYKTLSNTFTRVGTEKSLSWKERVKKAFRNYIREGSLIAEDNRQALHVALLFYVCEKHNIKITFQGKEVDLKEGIKVHEYFLENDKLKGSLNWGIWGKAEYRAYLSYTDSKIKASTGKINHIKGVYLVLRSMGVKFESVK